MAKKKPHFSEEEFYWSFGINNVIGLDEVGRGAFAGPIVAAGVIYQPGFKADFLSKVNDSKLLKPSLRIELSELIKANSIWTIQQVSLGYINKFGVGRANYQVLQIALQELRTKINSENYFAIVDGFDLRLKKQKAIIRGDSISLSIASASILAKVYRDNIMKKLAGDYPNYGFDTNVGYGTLKHREAIGQYGLCDLHRTSFNLNKFL